MYVCMQAYNVIGLYSPTGNVCILSRYGQDTFSGILIFFTCGFLMIILATLKRIDCDVINCCALSPIHTADADATRLDSFVSSAVCIGLYLYFCTRECIDFREGL